MIGHRILTALFGIPILLAGVYLGGALWQLIVFLLVLVGLLEFARMGGPGVYLDYLLLAGLSFVLITYSGITGTKLLVWLFCQVFYYLLRASFSGMHNFSSAFNCLGVFYVALPLSFLWIVRAEFGMIWTLFGIGVTWLTDTGAYFGGTRYGKRKLVPSISPNKTIEGALYGVGSACVGGIFFALATDLSVVPLALLAVVLSIVGQLGDLIESALKREKAVKDSGSLLPGHGGILDRFDSISFVFPVLFILLNLFL